MLQYKLTLNDICLAMLLASACTLSSTSPSARAVLLHTPHTEQHQSVELQVGGAGCVTLSITVS